LNTDKFKYHKTMLHMKRLNQQKSNEYKIINKSESEPLLKLSESEPLLKLNELEITK
jgi:hypothetical protein